MAWYLIVLIVIGAIILLKIVTFILLYLFHADDDLVLWFMVPIIALLSELKDKSQDKKDDARYEASRLEELRLDKENGYTPPFYFRLNKSIPIIPADWHGDMMVIYFEWEFDENVNRYIEKNYDKICSRLAEYNLQFIYAPRMLSNLTETIQYSYPDACFTDAKEFSPSDFYKIIADNVVSLHSKMPMLFIRDSYNSARYSEDELGDFAISNHGYLLNYVNEAQFEYIFNKTISHILRFGVAKYSEDKGEGEDVADYDSIDIIAAEIRDRINRLYAMGVSEYVIGKIVSLPEPKLSTLLITEDFRILLPDYSNMEITMPTLSRMLFFFYLRHPEGVLFKELRDHKKELSEIYRTISPSEDMEKMENSINDIVDSTKNSVNEKCSRVRTAFVSKFNDKLAKNYYITGAAGKPKCITLDRNQIQDRSGLIMR